MNSSPVNDLPTELVQRFHAMQAARVARAAGRCECNCRKCSTRATAQASPPMPETSTAT